MHQDQNKVRITKMLCASCGDPIPPFQKGKECPRCKAWPLCETCYEGHSEGGHVTSQQA